MGKKCQRCGYENADEGSFCLNCGTALSAAPANSHKSDVPTISFGGAATDFGARRETENFSNPNFPPSQPTLTQPKSKSKTGLIIGGTAALFFLVILTGAAIIFYNFYKSKSKQIYTVSSNSSPVVSPSPIDTDKTPAKSDRSLTNGAGAPQATFTPPVYATKTGVFTVRADQGWQTSEIDIIPLERFTVTAVGLADIDGVKTRVTPAGINDKSSAARRIYPEYPTGALLLRTRYADGHFGNVLPVGSSTNFQNFPDELGRLEFCINDNAPENNGGQFNVFVKMISVPKTAKK